jgi:signal transduction histidine kinase
LALPFYRDEQSLWRDVRERLADADQLVATLASQRQRDLGASPYSLVRAIDAIDSVDDALKALVTFNARQAKDRAAQITALRLRRGRIELALDGCSAILTIVVALLAIRAMQHVALVLEQRNRLQAMRAEELEQFAGRVAHDVRGPLSTTSMAIQLCKRKTENDRALALLERGARGVARVETIVDGLLRFARAAARPEPGVQTRVRPVVEGLVSELQPVAAEQHIELRAEPLPNEAVACNAGVLSSVIENLVRNAIKYMGEAPTRSIRLSAVVRGERLRFEVEDTGPGIAPLALPRIFEPYARGHATGQPGIGLGLATVRRIVEAHGGEVRVQSSPRGSLFSFDLPRAGVVPIGHIVSDGECHAVV